MGNCSGHDFSIPPGKGPHHVGCTDLMVGHTVEGTFFRLYYPCQLSERSENPDWVPTKEYFNGLADFMKINRRLSERIFNYLFGSCKIPATWNAAFKPNTKHPVVIFSHGLGAFRTLYSAICVELASQGFIVASVEHRSVFPPDRLTSMHFSLLFFTFDAYNPCMNLSILFHAQVKQRADECIRALDILFTVNSGNMVENVLKTPFDWSTLENSMDLCRIAVMGHSFGGATVIECLCKEVRFKCGIALDTWMFPLDEVIFPQVKQPIFFINSEKFQWAGNIFRMKKLDSATIPRKMITIRGAVHQSFPDFTFLTGNCLGKIFKLQGNVDPHLAMDLSNRASLAFLQRHLSLERDFNQWDQLIDGKDNHLIPGTNITLLQSAL
uniref:Platelet-activating factor acetylhydrolase n=1 Tax=Denticeps clupeoides TaxID=299321 RepID=A0AAY4F015_9TELE